MTYCIGIDPGASGGIAWFYGVVPYAAKMPETERDIWAALANLRRDGASYAFIELVRSSPQMGVTSAFTFGRGLGALRMALIGNGIPFEEIAPGKWQRAMGCLSKGDKNVTKRKAQEIFPGLKITHATADALLIAEYGRRELARREPVSASVQQGAGE